MSEFHEYYIYVLTRTIFEIINAHSWFLISSSIGSCFWKKKTIFRNICFWKKKTISRNIALTQLLLEVCSFIKKLYYFRDICFVEHLLCYFAEQLRTAAPKNHAYIKPESYVNNNGKTKLLAHVNQI